jgi:protein phosphatase
MDLSAILEIVAKTDRGVARSHNEDAVLANNALGLVVLADGMGGYNAGEVASGMATAILGTALEKRFIERAPQTLESDGRFHAHAALADEIALTNTAIYEAAQNQSQYAGMGTTLVAGVFYDNRLTVAHIGDSRLYRLRGGDFQQVTCDHSLLQEQIDSGLITKEQARHSQNKNLVTRALGVDPAVEAEIHTHAVVPGDIYLLCSDGLNDMVEDDEIGMTVGMLAANIGLCAEQLIQMANDNGGRDNISVILVKIRADFAVPRGWWVRFLSWFK